MPLKNRVLLAIVLIFVATVSVHAAHPRRLRIVAYGTSLTALYPWTGDLESALNGCGLDVRVINTAQSAKTSAWAVENLKRRVLDRHPDIVLLEFAINDAYRPFGVSLAASRTNMEHMVDAIHARFPRARIILMSMNAVGKEWQGERPELTDYYDQYRLVAKDKGADFLDNFPAWSTILQHDPDRFAAMVPDGLHPTEAAHRMVTVRNLVTLLAGPSCPVDQSH